MPEAVIVAAARTAEDAAPWHDPRADGFWAREITPVTTPDGTLVTADDGGRL
jgi:hypothetical protein